MEDRYGHRISYLRVSITDRCNERCTYCMPRELQEWLPREGILSFEEMLRLIRIAAGLGVRKVRVTGGEPLTRRCGMHENTFSLRSPSGIGRNVCAAGHGFIARIFRSISNWVALQAISPFSRVSFGAYVASVSS